MKSRFLPLFVIVASLLWAGALAATTVKQLSLGELTQTSDVIVLGEVTDQRTDVVEGRVFTTTTLTPQEIWKGSASQQRVVMRHLGGRTDDLETRVAGMPSFQMGEKVLVFLVKPKNYKFFIVNGLAQGKLTVDGGTATPNVGDLRLMETPTTTSVPTNFHLKPQDLKSLKSQVNTALELQ